MAADETLGRIGVSRSLARGDYPGLTRASSWRSQPVTPLAAKLPEQSCLDSGRRKTSAYADKSQGSAYHAGLEAPLNDAISRRN